MKMKAENISVFKYKNYKKFINESLSNIQERGIKTKLAKSLNCQSGFISQVLSGSSHFSQEHIIKVANFLQITSEERHFLLLLLNYSRAGTSELEQHYQIEIEKIKRQREKIKNAIKTNVDISEEDKLKYYSNWYYAAIYVAVSIYDSAQEISEKLNIPLDETISALEFLEKTKMIHLTDSKYSIHNGRMHLNDDSPLINKHHMNWRFQAIRSLDMKKESDLHYSSVSSISKEAYQEIKEYLIQFIENAEKSLKESKDESEIYSLCIDLFTL